MRVWPFAFPKIDILSMPPAKEVMDRWKTVLRIRLCCLLVALCLVVVGLSLFASFTSSLDSSIFKNSMVAAIAFAALCIVVMLTLLVCLGLSIEHLGCLISLNSELNLEEGAKYYIESQMDVGDEDRCDVPLLSLVNYAQLEEVRQYLIKVKQQERELTRFEYHALSKWYEERKQRAEILEAQQKLSSVYELSLKKG